MIILIALYLITLSNMLQGKGIAILYTDKW